MEIMYVCIKAILFTFVDQDNGASGWVVHQLEKVWVTLMAKVQKFVKNRYLMTCCTLDMFE